MSSTPPGPSAPQVSLEIWEPGHPGVEIVETHVSAVAFDGDLVHKRKKAVQFAFVDLRTPEARELMCRREVELNRRFSPDVYLGVEDVVDDAGQVVDHAVLMRRMPAERRLATLVLEHHDVADCLRHVARKMAASHAAAARSDEISSVATPEALLELWSRNLHELAPFVPDPLDPETVARIDGLARRYLEGRHALLLGAHRTRVHRGRARRPAGRGHLLPRRRSPHPRRTGVRRSAALGRRAVRHRVPGHGPGAARAARSGAGLPRLVLGALRRDAPAVARAPLHRLSGAGALEGRLPAGAHQTTTSRPRRTWRSASATSSTPGSSWWSSADCRGPGRPPWPPPSATSSVGPCSGRTRSARSSSGSIREPMRRPVSAKASTRRRRPTRPMTPSSPTLACSSTVASASSSMRRSRPHVIGTRRSTSPAPPLRT